MNEAEQIEIERVNRARSQQDAEDRPDSLATAFATLADEGWELDAVLELVSSLDIQPTLTAHPTEARRRTTVDLQRAVGARLRELHRSDATAAERHHARRRLAGLVRVLLATDELPPQRRSVEDEVRLGLYFLGSSIWEAVPRIHRDVRDALRRHFDEETRELPPFVRHRSWIGGDRDGNPNVTPELTRWTFEQHRELALELYLDELTDLRRELPASERIVDFPRALLDSIEAEPRPLPDELAEQYRNEPLRTKLTHMIRKLERLIEEDAGYCSDDFLRDLRTVYRATRDALGEDAADGRLRDLLVRARTFGFHLAAVDLRQHSGVHASAVDELLATAGAFDGYCEADESERQRVLERELQNPRPLVDRRDDLSDGTARLMETFDVVREAIERDPASVGAWIVSMTHAPSAMLEVLLLAKETGLWIWNDGAAKSKLDVVPLVETVRDLDTVDELLDGLFRLDSYRAQLEARGRFQEIMLGYSDSNKDGGYWAAQAALYDAQKRIAAVCDEHGVEHRLFHGRGGTVGRGGGRANRAIFALPPRTRNGRIRFTEQGEIISFRYANEALAHRHLEQVVSATLLTAAHPSESEPPANAEETLRKFGRAAREAYRELLATDRFWSWYRSATPIEQISRLPIASRPVSRAEGDLAFEDLRAIPWNFAWTQTRYCIPGWFGLQVIDDDDAPDVAELHELWSDWDFFRTIVRNAELEMARSRLSISRYYDELADDSFHELLAEAFERSRDVLLDVTGHSELLEDDPVIRESIELRNPYTDVLNLIQVELLTRSRTADQAGPLQEMLLASLNGIAAAMQSTG